MNFDEIEDQDSSQAYSDGRSMSVSEVWGRVQGWRKRTKVEPQAQPSDFHQIFNKIMGSDNAELVTQTTVNGQTEIVTWKGAGGQLQMKFNTMDQSGMALMTDNSLHGLYLNIWGALGDERTTRERYEEFYLPNGSVQRNRSDGTGCVASPITSNYDQSQMLTNLTIDGPLTPRDEVSDYKEHCWGPVDPTNVTLTKYDKQLTVLYNDQSGYWRHPGQPAGEIDTHYWGPNKDDNRDKTIHPNGSIDVEYLEYGGGKKYSIKSDNKGGYIETHIGPSPNQSYQIHWSITGDQSETPIKQIEQYKQTIDQAYADLPAGIRKVLSDGKWQIAIHNGDHSYHIDLVKKQLRIVGTTPDLLSGVSGIVNRGGLSTENSDSDAFIRAFRDDLTKQKREVDLFPNTPLTSEQQLLAPYQINNSETREQLFAQLGRVKLLGAERLDYQDKVFALRFPKTYAIVAAQLDRLEK